MTWCYEKLWKIICEGLIDYVRLEWYQITKHPKEDSRIVEAFDKVWCHHHTICGCDGSKVRWCCQSPNNNNIS